MKLLIKNGRLLSPYQQIDHTFDILIVEGVIEKIARRIDIKDARVLDASRYIVAPGFIDMHTHLREPGKEDAETIETGARAAAAGGFTQIACMPNTNPVNDHIGITNYILGKAKAEACITVHPIAAISMQLKGEQITEMNDLKEAGAVAFSDDGNCISNTLLMRQALEYAKMFDVPIIDHCEDKILSNGGCMNEGYYASIMGLRGIPCESEEVMIARDIALARLTKGCIHIAHVSSKESVNLIRAAKKHGIKITAEVTPHHFTLTDEFVYKSSYDPNTKMNPPLRSKEDIKELLAGIKDGTIDTIATDHAPHKIEDKMIEYDKAAFGIIGLETALPLCITYLVQTKIIDLNRLVEMLSVNPAKIFRLPVPVIEEGKPANLTVFGMTQKNTIKVQSSFSKSRNTPFDGWSFKGKIILTMANGKIAFDAE
ncbi:MAG: dihydroorotase [Candidatus Fischerbacteria bacterium RBG_13_37_8]|uniref:Dihydroorotase n=1 Tax=Candidatus Fischerbacteria bacterium RBG_13_37_8 TaxID=1817863 RepID=A0A1F5VQ77_9BACT|nr:MAG: dihydroorotase [Candidatus Fischerbacteria bacterium RBG_13_37_8]